LGLTVSSLLGAGAGLLLVAGSVAALGLAPPDAVQMAVAVG